MYIGASSGTDWRLGKNIMGTNSNTNFGITKHSGTAIALEIDSSLRTRFRSSDDYIIGLVDSSGTDQWWLKAYNSNGNFAIHENGVGDQFTIAAGGDATFSSSLNVGKSLHVGPSQSRYIFNSDTVQVAGSGTSNAGPIEWKEGTHYIPSLAYAFKVRLVTTGTGTDTGASYIVYYNNTDSAWVVRHISLANNGSNHPLLTMVTDGTGNYMAAYDNHPGTYNVRYFVESWDTGDQDMDGHAFGSDFQWQRLVDTLTYPDGNVVVSSGFVSASNFRPTNIVTNKVVKFNGTQLDDSIITDDGTTATVAGNLEVDGNLNIVGNSSVVNVEDLNVEQGEITLNYNASSDTSGSANGSGIRIQDAVNGSTDAVMSWNTSGYQFNFSHGMVIGGTNSGNTVSLVCKDAGVALLQVGDSTNGTQGTGAIEVTQDGDHGGGISYNGDGSPAFASGETADHITFFRNNNGTRTEVFSYPYNSNNVTFNGSVAVNQNGLIKFEQNTDVDSAAPEAIASVVKATHTAAFFDYVIKKGTNVRAGVVAACHDGTSVEYAETSTVDLGDTSDVTLSVDISGIYMRLIATTTSNDWSVKSLIRAI